MRERGCRGAADSRLAASQSRGARISQGQRGLAAPANELRETAATAPVREGGGARTKMSAETTYQIGIATRDITPTTDEFAAGQLYLWGFGFGDRNTPVRRTRTATDRLRATALCISASNGTVVLLALDVGALSAEMTAQIRAALQANHGIPPEHVCVNVSHTHAAPTMVSLVTWPAGINTANPGYRDRVIAAAIGSVADALSARVSAQLYTGRGESFIGTTRHNGAAGYDPTLDVIVAKAGGRTVATVFSVACHPVLVQENSVSADYPGVTRALVERDHGGVSMFLQGFAGQTFANIDFIFWVDIM